MANQLIAMKIQPPSFDYGKVVDTAQRHQMNQQRIQGAEMDNELAGMKLEEAKDLHGAQMDYRSRSAAGDPNADEALGGYPELQKKIWEAFDGMDPATYKKAKKKAARFGEAAKNVLMFNDGTPEQVEAWNTEIGKLAEDGTIPQEQAAELIKSGPNPLLIEQALSIEEFAKNHDSKARLNQRKQKFYEDKEARLAEDAEADDIRADIKTEQAQARIDIAREKADIAADRIEQQVKTKEANEQGKSDRHDDTLAEKLEDDIAKYREDIGLNEEDLETDDPDKFAKLSERADAYQARLFKRFGFGPDGRRTKKRALGGDKVETETPPDAKAPKKTIKVGAKARNKQTGEVLVWSGTAWEPEK